MTWWQRFREERGYAVIMTSLVLVPLMGFAGFAVDVGAWYARASAIQRAADAAALAGVVWQPDFASAEAAAIAEARRNGFDNADPNITVTVTDEGDNQLLVQIIDADADMFFSGLFLDQVQIGRQAVAEYNEPVALGAPGNSIGHQMPAGCDDIIGAAGSCAGSGPGWFLDAGGPRSPHIGGEAITTQCLVSWGANCLNSNPINPNYDASGYVFAIDVPEAGVGNPITVQIFDPSHYAWSGKEIPHWGSSSAVRTWLEFSIFEADGVGLTTPETRPIGGCTKIFDPAADPGENAQWATLCTFTPTVADIYPLRVRVQGFAGAEDLAITQDGFSMRAISAGASQPSFYALEYLPMLSNAEATTTFTFAEIADVHAGKTIRMRLFDAGDSNQSGTFTMRPLDPNGQPVGTCRYRSYFAHQDPAAQTWRNSDSGSQCEVITRTGSTSLYNDKWLDIEIDIPANYTCTSCWWSVDYSIPAGVAFYERTTWTVLIVGDPVRLVE